jgi:CHAT domain-containing protein
MAMLQLTLWYLWLAVPWAEPGPPQSGAGDAKAAIAKGEATSPRTLIDPTAKDFLDSEWPKIQQLRRLRGGKEREAWVREHGPTDPDLFHVLVGLGEIAGASGQLAEKQEWSRLVSAAAEVYDEARVDRSSKTFEVRERLLASAALARGDIHIEEGDELNALPNHLLALDYFRKAKARRIALGLPPYSRFDEIFAGAEGVEAIYYLRLYRDYGMLGDWKSAREYDRLAYEVIKDSKKLLNYSLARLHEADRAIWNREFEQARNILKSAIGYVFAPGRIERGGLPAPAPTEDMIDLYRRGAQISGRLGHVEDALGYYDEAIKWDKKYQQYRLLFRDRLEKAELLGRAGRYDEAKEAVQAAGSAFSEDRTVLGAIRGLFVRDAPVDPDSALMPSDRYRLHATSGDIARRRAERSGVARDEQEAEAEYRKAIAAAEEIRENYQLPQYKATVSENYLGAYEGLLSTIARKYARDPDPRHIAEALRVAEQGVARALLAIVAEERSELRDRLPVLKRSLLQLHESNYKIVIVRLLHGNPTPAERQDLIRRLEVAVKSRQQIIEQFRESHPRETELFAPSASGIVKFADEVVGVGRAAPGPRPNEALPEGVGLLRYFVGEAETFAIYAGPGRPRLFVVETEELRRLTESFRRAVSDVTRVQTGEVTVLGHKLYEMLVAPAAPPFGGPLKTLVIIPDDFLFELPFDSLVVDPDEVRLEYLIQKVIVTHAPSLMIYRLLLQSAPRVRPGPPRLLGVGDPHYGPTPGPDPRGTRSGILERGGLDLRRLPFSGEEVRDIASLFGPAGARSLLGPEARKSRIKMMTLADYDFVHFAVHGLLPGQVGGIVQPTLALTPSTNPDDPDDGLLTLDETLVLTLRAHLTVLSACSSGRGDILRGEGVLSFTRSMLTGGSDHTLVSLWAVADRSTAMLMGRYYRRLLAGVGPATALRDAKLWLMTQDIPLLTEPEAQAPEAPRPPPQSARAPTSLPGNLPYFWGGFVLYGPDNRPTFEVPADSAVLGTRAAPVQCDGPSGERRYLDRLRCPDGKKLIYDRRGTESGRALEAHRGHLLDVYQARCEDGRHALDVYTCMYHYRSNERRPIPRYSLAE